MKNKRYSYKTDEKVILLFQLLISEHIKRKVYKDRESARKDNSNCIEMFCNPVCRHGLNNDISPVEFEKLYAKITIKYLEH